MKPHKYPALAAISCLAALNGTPASAQSFNPSTDVQYYNVTEPSNWDCASAIQFCSDVDFTFTASQHGEGCLSFFVVTTGAASISASCNGGKVRFYFYPGISIDQLCSEGYAPGCDMGSASNSASVGPSTAGIAFLVWDPSPDDHGHLTIDIKSGSIGPCSQLRECSDCLPAFNPEPGRTYVVSAWCDMPNAPAGTGTYAIPNGPLIKITVTGGPSTSIYPKGPIIDGWQRMEGEIAIPVGATNVKVDLSCGADLALFDDVRFFPSDASMKCMVYDASLRLQAELDERHYATIYEYDGEGKLARVKKETERGIMTIQETRYNAAHIDP